MQFSFDLLTGNLAPKEIIDINGTPCAIVDAAKIVDISMSLKNDHGFIQCIDGLGSDRFTRTDRFEMTYNLRNPHTKERVFLKVRCDERTPHIPSVTSVWQGAGWHEREAYDMIGIVFDGHKDLRRMYMPEDYKYHPLRKDFPLTGIAGSIPLPINTPRVDERLN